MAGAGHERPESHVSDSLHEEAPLASCGLVELYSASIARMTWLYTLAPNARRERAGVVAQQPTEGGGANF